MGDLIALRRAQAVRRETLGLFLLSAFILRPAGALAYDTPPEQPRPGPPSGATSATADVDDEAGGLRGARTALTEELHYLTTYHGQVIGVRRVRVCGAEHDGRPAVLRDFREEQRIRARGVTQRTVTERVELTDADGRAIRLVERRTEAGQVIDMGIEVTDDAVIFRTRVAGRPKAFRATRQGPVRFDIDGETFVRKGLLRPGATVRDYVVARVELGIAELEAKVLGRVALPEVQGVYAAGAEGFRITVANVSGAGEPWELVVDKEGRTVELRIGPMLVQRCSSDQARLPRRAVVLENRFPTERVKRPESVRSMTVEVLVPSDARGDVFPDSLYGTSGPAGRTDPRGGRDPGEGQPATSAAEGQAPSEARPALTGVAEGQAPSEARPALTGVATRYVLSLAEARPDGRLPRAELSEEDRSRFLQTSHLVECDEPEIRALAREILDGETEPLKQVLFLTRWVYRNLRKRSAGPATASALEALRARAGDCTEHAALLAALARASGLPARRAMGLVHDGEGFEFHAWTEAFIDDPGVDGTSSGSGTPGSWVPLDPTLGRVGVPALYVLLGREGDLVNYDSRANALQGRATMRLTKVE